MHGCSTWNIFDRAVSSVVFHVEHCAQARTLAATRDRTALHLENSIYHGRKSTSEVQFLPFQSERELMDIPNAFINHPGQPTASEISAALGTCAGLWEQLLRWLATEKGVAEQEWNSTSVKYGWSLRLKLKKRTIVYLAPCNGCFRASFVLGDRAVEAARVSDLPKGILKAIDEAPRYAEGTGVRLMIKAERDLAGIRKLAAIKLAN